MRKLFASIVLLCLAGAFCHAQKVVDLHGMEEYTDRLRFLPDSTEHDLRLRIFFDEDANTLDVSVHKPDAMLFAFQRNVLYKNVFKCCGKLRADKLPYKVEYDPTYKYKLSDDVRRSLGGNLNRHGFRIWCEFEGMEQAPSVHSIPEDTLRQVFRINPSGSRVTVRLRDIFLAVRKGSGRLSWKKYILKYHSDLNEEYQLNLLRNPCRRNGVEIDSLNAACTELSEALVSLESAYPDGLAHSYESLQLFHSTRDGLLAKYPRREVTTDCPDLASVAESYNACVDHLVNMKCSLDETGKGEVVTGFGTAGSRIDAQGLLYRARQLDEMTAALKLASSKTERLDLMHRCDRVIDEATAITIGHSAVTPEDHKAVEIFSKALDYYKKNCR